MNLRNAKRKHAHVCHKLLRGSENLSSEEILFLFAKFFVLKEKYNDHVSRIYSAK